MVQLKAKNRLSHRILIKIVLKVLERGARGVVVIDKNAKTYLSELKEDYSFKLSVSEDKTKYFFLKRKGNRLVKVRKKDNIKPDLEISFKNSKAILPLLLGQCGVSQAYAESKFIVYGDISKSMIVVDLLNLTEAYLFPKFILSKFMNRIPKKSSSMILAYLHVIFGTSKK